MKKVVLVLVLVSLIVSSPALADTWGESGDGWRPFINFEAWWDYVNNLWLPVL